MRTAATIPAIEKPLPLSLVKALVAAGVAPAEFEGISEEQALAMVRR